MSRDIDDLQLIDRVLAGEQNVYAQLVERYKSYAFTIALKVLNVRQDAEEAAQDAFIKAYHNLAKFNREAKFSTWLYRIVFNTAVSLRRTRKVTFQDIPESAVAPGYDTEKTLEKSDRKRFIEAGLARLNEADRVALTLFYLKELSLEEIGDITGMPANTVKVRIHRARLRLADEMKTILKNESLLL
ncbi:MAG TPA: sigma-70 family RNA polymerase sigma factor [Cyclobacteriaceae bacterium]|nr:sigma-70 family RNA polymerase sigma factor [Cyclobacteriaceae bacterium]